MNEGNPAVTAPAENDQPAIEPEEGNATESATPETDPTRELVNAHLELAALKRGIELPDSFANFLNLDRLLTENGVPDREAIEDLVTGFFPAKPKAPKFDQAFSSGPQGTHQPAQSRGYATRAINLPWESSSKLDARNR